MSDEPSILPVMNYVETDLLPAETLVEWSRRMHPKRCETRFRRAVRFVSGRPASLRT